MSGSRPTPVNTKHLYNICTMLDNVEDVGPTLYKCYTTVLCLLGRDTRFICIKHIFREDTRLAPMKLFDDIYLPVPLQNVNYFLYYYYYKVQMTSLLCLMFAYYTLPDCQTGRTYYKDKNNKQETYYLSNK